ncbi:amidase signature domain-containing protein [Cercophora newfieldiana]|uniref:Amidase signature domain-containing protein n=1 Tax=Cercophora newfieldiana TaxID=92897 RepID=A0AA39YPX0_9PEZI|nr:amidase signature domain-containing protein [Cercophora newfieldiana]
MAIRNRSVGLSVLSLVSSLSLASAKLAATGLTVTLNDVYYYISPFSSGKVDVPCGSLSAVPKVFGFKPVAIVNQGDVAQEDVSDLFAKWATIDDVFQPAFADGVFLAGSGVSCPGPYRNSTKACEVKAASRSFISLQKSKVPSGPYFLEVATGQVYPVYRLYEDFAGAFMESVLPTPDGGFQVLSAQIPGSAALTIGVPSRLYFTKTAEKPLAGVRLGVKDIYRIKGMKGSNGNRAWYSLYPASTYTGPAIQNLIDAGAQIVGLQKTSQFANGESATADWVDYHAPFNPRGDGYQQPSSSSSGAGASVAAYEWLDIAIGSDTGGSVRGPAGVSGLFGNRPSHGLVSLDNVMPLSPTLDTPGFLVRDPYLWDAANAALYGSNYKSMAKVKPKYPTNIKTVSFPTNPNQNAAAGIVTKFLSDLTAFVGGTANPLNLATAWAASTPAEAGGASLSEFLNTTYATLITKEQIELVREPFYRDYAAAHDGRRPFVNPVPLSRWGYGDTIPDSAHGEAVRNKTIFMEWFNTEILAPSEDPAECSSSLLLYIQSSGGLSPRNRYGSVPGVPFGFSTGRASVFSETPDHVFPLGQIAVNSTISQHEEFSPVGVSVMAAKGCDGLLVKLAQDLVEADILKVPLAGSTVEGGPIIRRRMAEMRDY